MATPSRIVGPQVFLDSVTFTDTVSLPDGCVTDASIPDGADIDPLKLGHIHAKTHSQPNTTATTETRVVHVAIADGAIFDVVAGLIAACAGAATVTVDLQKSTGGAAFATVLSAPISLSSADAAIVPEAGVVTTPDFVAGDVFRIVITATAGGGTIGTGLFVELRVREAAQ